MIEAFIEPYNNGWLLQRHGYMTPARAREKLSRKAAWCMSRPLVQNRDRYSGVKMTSRGLLEVAPPSTRQPRPHTSPLLGY